MSRVCTAGGTGYTISDTPGASGTAMGTAASGWVNNPSIGTWKASGPGGSAKFIENMVTRAAVAGDGVTYIHTDGLGGPVSRTDSTGNIVSRTRYEPYGLTAGGATPTIGFTGHVNDADTGLVYMQQRYYDPVAGRLKEVAGAKKVTGATAAVAKEASAAGKAFSKEKQALVDMAKTDKKAGITSADMKAYKELNAKLPDPFPTNKVRGPEAHSSGAPSSQTLHGHVGPVDYIPVKD